MNKERRIGTCLDGVIAKNFLNKTDFKPKRLSEYYDHAVPTVIYSQLPFDAIITSRSILDKEVTINWLIYFRIECEKLVMFPKKLKKTKKTIAEFKAKHINDLGITEYFESDEKIAEHLKISCPDTKINLVEVTDPINPKEILDFEDYEFDNLRFIQLYLETV